MKKLFIGSFFFLSTLMTFSLATTTAEAAKGCFCEIGNYPSNQQGFFQVGCDAWLSEQKGCSVKKIVAQDTNYAGLIASGQAGVSYGGELAIGYVGHWGSSEEMVGYLMRSVTPALKNWGVSVTVDNTACSAMNRPEVVNAYVQSLNLPSTQKLEVKGVQLTSIGMWEKFIPSRSNFWASVSSKSPAVTYPKCNYYEGSNCMAMVQAGMDATCDRKGEKIQLTCCEVKKNPYSTISGGKQWVWSEEKFCLPQY